MKLHENGLEHTEVEVISSGGKNEKIEGRFDLLETDAMIRLAAVMEYGHLKYGDINWRLDPPQLHVKHAIGHLLRYLKLLCLSRVHGEDHVAFSTDGKDDELAH